jgi:hypothetical protein
MQPNANNYTLPRSRMCVIGLPILVRSLHVASAVGV